MYQNLIKWALDRGIVIQNLSDGHSIGQFFKGMEQQLKWNMHIQNYKPRDDRRFVYFEDVELPISGSTPSFLAAIRIWGVPDIGNDLSPFDCGHRLKLMFI